jgi:hypothetical protein
MINVIFKRYAEVKPRTRASVWRFDSDSVHLEVESDLCALTSVLRITCDEARALGEALIAAANTPMPAPADPVPAYPIPSFLTREAA